MTQLHYEAARLSSELFRDPPRQYGLRPLWFWNGPLTPEDVRRQIESMVSEGIYGAYMMTWSGLRPRYLSEDFWELVAAAVEKAREVGFSLCFADEFNWPSGEARDYALPGYPSRVLEANPQFRMRSLFPERHAVVGPTELAIAGDDLAYAVAARIEAAGLASASLVEVTSAVRERGSWAVPEGQWALYTFRLRESIGYDGGLVDLMNPEAIRTFIDLVYEQWYRRFPDDFGTTIAAARSDHEGDYGYRLAWTPTLFDEFRRRKGYDLVPHLPLLLEDGGQITPKVRCDWFELVGDLYAEAFLEQLARWGAAHGIRTDGHVWEESLHAHAAYEGDHFRQQRAFGNPGIDTLFEWGRWPRHFLEARSVAHFRELPLVVEHQGVQGADNYLSPERAKRTTNAIAAWGTGVFNAHAMRANPERMDFPEDWFEAQPWWPHMRHYSRYVARLAYMNAVGRHVCELAVYYPIESAWANGDVVFSDERWNYMVTDVDLERGPIIKWGNIVDELDTAYAEILDRLPRAQWDLDVIDAHYLAEASIGDGRLRIGPESFGVLVLPPMTCMRLVAARRVREFADAGGLVIAVGRLPLDSMENGRDDPALVAELDAIRPLRVPDTDGLLELLERRVPKDLRVVGGDPEHLFFAHRVDRDRHAYWLVNDTPDTRSLRVRVAVTGRPERWDPDGGVVASVAYTTYGDATELHLEFAPWQAYYVVFDRDAPPQPLAVEETSLESYLAPERHDGDVILRGSARGDRDVIDATVSDGQVTYHGSMDVEPLPQLLLPGPWRFRADTEVVPVSYARSATAGLGVGAALGWCRADFNDRFWDEQWLSPERFTLRDWWVIGPWDYHSHLGYNEQYPPEHEIDLGGIYQGKDGPVSWRHHTSPSHVIDLGAALAYPVGGADSLGIMRFLTAYALTHVHSPNERECELLVVGDSNAKVWLNDELVMSERDDHLSYLEMRDAYAQRARVHLRPGWNRLLVKVGQAVRYAGGLRLYARMCDDAGLPLEGLVHSATPDDRPSDATSEQPLERWYRVQVPTGAQTLLRASLPDGAEVYVDGERISAQGKVVEFEPGSDRLLAVRVPDGGEIIDFLQFEPGTAECPLGSWSHTGLSFFSGVGVYETEFDVPAAYLRGRLELDLGTVGVVAAVWLNGDPIGTRVWRPFAFDVTGRIREGRNALRIEVTNTQTNRRAQRFDAQELWGVTVSGPKLLDAVDENGLLGPVRLVAWTDVELECRRTD